MSSLLLLTLAANAKTIVPAPASLERSQITVMVVMECSPAAYADKLKYISTGQYAQEVQDFLKEPNFPGINRVEHISGLSQAETLAELEALAKQGPFERFYLVTIGPGIGADAGDPGFMCADFDAKNPDSALLLEDVKTAVDSASPVKIALFDNSRNANPAMADELKVGTYGPSADDWQFEGGYAMSAGNPRRYTEGSFLTALRTVLVTSNGAAITVNEFVARMRAEGLKINASLAMYDKPAEGSAFEDGNAALFVQKSKLVNPTNDDLTPKPAVTSAVELPTKRKFHVTTARGISFGTAGACLVGVGVGAKLSSDLRTELEQPIPSSQVEEWQAGLGQLHTLWYTTGGLAGCAALGLAGGFIIPEGKKNQATAVLTVGPTGVGLAGTF